MPAFTLEGFESPEEVQARIGKAKQASFRPTGDINSMIYQTAAQGAAGMGGAVAGALGYEDPSLKRAKQVQELMKGLDPADPQSYFEGSKRLNAAGLTKESLKMGEIGNDLLSDKKKAIAAASSGNSYSIPKEIMMPDKDGNMVAHTVPYDTRKGKWLLDQAQISQKGVSHQGNLARTKAANRVFGKDQAEVRVDLEESEFQANETITLIDQILEHPELESSTGFGLGTVAQFIPRTDSSELRTMRKQLEGKNFMTVYKTLKGGGQITEIEGEKATIALNRMENATSVEAYTKAANELKQHLTGMMKLRRRRAGMTEKKIKAEQEASTNTYAMQMIEKARELTTRKEGRKSRADVMRMLRKGFAKKGLDMSLLKGF